jgi:hypothetical protein
MPPRNRVVCLCHTCCREHSLKAGASLQALAIAPTTADSHRSKQDPVSASRRPFKPWVLALNSELAQRFNTFPSVPPGERTRSCSL